MSWEYYNKRVNIESLVGLTFTSVTTDNSEEVVFNCADESQYKMMHLQDCCECVQIEDIVGDLEDLVNTPILTAEERSNREDDGQYGDSQTWTFYCLRTIKGTVDIRWLGRSNGYYSESVDIVKVK